MQAGSPYFARESFWGIEATLRAAGWRTTPYHVDVPSFGDWGFVLAAPGRAPRAGARAAARARGCASSTAPRSRPRRPSRPTARGIALKPSTLNRPRLLDYQRRGYQGY